MSYLMRNGTGRNNILFGGSSNTNGNYLRRTSTGRNDISFININNTNGTYNLLERYNTSRNSIRWNNITFSFGVDLNKYPLASSNGYTGMDYDMVFTHSTYSKEYKLSIVDKSTYNTKIRLDYRDEGYSRLVIYFASYTDEIANNFVNDIKSNCSRLYLVGEDSISGFTIRKTILFSDLDDISVYTSQIKGVIFNSDNNKIFDVLDLYFELSSITFI